MSPAGVSMLWLFIMIMVVYGIPAFYMTWKRTHRPHSHR